MPILFLIRHGETAYIGKRLTGCTPGVHLVQRGEEQARQIAESLKTSNFKAIYSSPLERAMETAQPLAIQQNKKIIQFNGLLEVDFGLWTGKSFRWLHRQPQWKDLHDNPRFQFPGGDSLPAVRRRVAKTLDEISRKHGKKDLVALFTHCDIVRYSVEHALGMPPGGFHKLAVDTASLTIVRFQDGKISLLGFNLKLPYQLPDF